MSGFGLTLDLVGFDSMVDGMAKEVQDAARPAAQAGAQVLYDVVKINVRKLGKKTGKLEQAIYQVYSEDNSGKGRAQYHVSWNARKAPHGHLVENGHIQKFVTVVSKKTGKWITLKKRPLASPRHVAAQPFVRPALAHLPRAEAAAKAEFFRRINNKGGRKP